MLLSFFTSLRAAKIPTSLGEWMNLMDALRRGLVDADLSRFYFVSRALLVKNESHYDAFDQVFLHCFDGGAAPSGIDDRILDWLEREPLKKYFSEEELARLQKLDPEALQKLFEERLKEQREAHNGGNRWIGTGGTSPFGHGGAHPSGIRVGGASGNRMAVKVAGERRYRNYRNDLILDTRQIQVALKKLRELKRHGIPDELDLEATIDKTCRNAGDIDIVMRAERKNRTKLLLLMDVGGTMGPYADTVSQLFSAAHRATHFKDFKYYYFHNCVYSRVWRDMERSDAVLTADLFRSYDPEYKLVVVGDAWMNPYELYYDNGAIDFFARETTAGISWLDRLSRHFKKSVWLNPESKNYWEADTIAAIGKVFKMHPLTLEGLESGIRELTR